MVSEVKSAVFVIVASLLLLVHTHFSLRVFLHRLRGLLLFRALTHHYLLLFIKLNGEGRPLLRGSSLERFIKMSNIATIIQIIQ